MNVLNKKINTYRNVLLFFLLTSLLLSEEPKSIAFGATFGLMSEKIPATFFEMTGGKIVNGDLPSIKIPDTKAFGGVNIPSFKWFNERQFIMC